MTIKGSTNQACAVCKYQRRKCSKECPLSPYFPADRPKQFQNAHRLFGVRNITRIIEKVHPDQREEAMKSIIYESNMRAQFPVHGCLGIIWQYHNQLKQTIEELNYVNTQLAFYKENCQYQIPNSTPPYSPSSQLNFGIASQYDGGITMLNDFLLGNGNAGVLNGACLEGNDMTNSLINVQPTYDDVHGISDASINPMIIPPGYVDIPFDAIVDDRQSYIDHKEACESSAESSFKGTINQMEPMSSENELKSAAACFSLTN